MTTKTSIAAELRQAEQVIINGVGRQDVRAKLLDEGIAASELDAGKELLALTLEAVARQDRLQGERQERTKDQNTISGLVEQELKDLASAVDMAYPGEASALAELGLADGIPRTQAGLLETVRTAATNLETTARQELIKQNGFGPKRIGALAGLAGQFGSAITAQDAAATLAQQATAEQTKALKTLRAWRLKMLRLAKIALRDTPQMLELLGVVVK